jgi:general secretion pathway protein M
MKESFGVWWRTRTLREQRLLLAMAGLSVVVLLWLAIIRPIGDRLSEARERHGAAVLALAEARARAGQIGLLEQRRPANPGGPLETVLNQSATEAGFPVARVEREGLNQATMVIDSVKPQAFFAWVRRMEDERGMIVERLSARANADQTLAIRITFRAREG